MSTHQEPFPLTVFDRSYNVVQANAAMFRLLKVFFPDVSRLPQPLNVLKLLFDPELARPFVRNWDTAARPMLARIHREVLARPNDEALAALLEKLLSYPGVPKDWQVPDLTQRSLPVLEIHLGNDDIELGFLTTVTYFSAPQNVALQELYIESYFPLDARTTSFCEQLARNS